MDHITDQKRDRDLQNRNGLRMPVFFFSLPVVPAWCTLNAESLHAFLVSHAEREDEGA